MFARGRVVHIIKQVMTGVGVEQQCKRDTRRATLGHTEGQQIRSAIVKPTREGGPSVLLDVFHPTEGMLQFCPATRKPPLFTGNEKQAQEEPWARHRPLLSTASVQVNQPGKGGLLHHPLHLAAWGRGVLALPGEP